MPRFLVLDNDGTHSTLIVAATSRSGFSVEAVRTWADEPFTVDGKAEAQGRALRDRLAGWKIATAPLIIGVARDKVALKEVKYPAVAPSEEPGLVRFQALKELTDGDDSAIDFQPRETVTNGERKAMVMAVRKSVLKAGQALAQAAGLKLAGLTPRAFGLIAAARATLPAPEGTIAVLAMGGAGGEFVVAAGAQVLFARPLPSPALASEPALLGEVRRNLAVFNGQAGSTPVTALYIAEGATPPSAAAKLRATLAIPVQSIEPLSGFGKLTSESPAGSMAAAVGLARWWAAGTLPINFAKPREPKPEADPNRRKLAFGLGLAAAALLALVGFGAWKLSEKDRQLTALSSERARLDKDLQELEPYKRRAKALDDWRAGQVVWLDELYDIAARNADPTKLRVTQITADPIPATAKSKSVAKVTIKGLTTDEPKPLQDFMNGLVMDGEFVRVGPPTVAGNTMGTDRRTFTQQFTAQFEVLKRPPDKYTRTFNAEAPAKRARARASDGGFNLLDIIGGAP